MGLLEGKRILVTGVLTDASLAFAVARRAQGEGAEVVLSGAGRGLSLTRRTARKLPEEAEVLEMDVTEPAQLAAAATALGQQMCIRDRSRPCVAVCGRRDRCSGQPLRAIARRTYRSSRMVPPLYHLLAGVSRGSPAEGRARSGPGRARPGPGTRD